MKKIFIFGDSIAYGAWDPQGGWVERLRQWVFVTTRGEYNRGTFLYNLSVAGDTTADLLRRFPTEIGARQPGDFIVFAAGINDAQCINGQPMATPADVCTNVRALIQRARACAPRLCWVGLTPVDEARTTPIPWMPDRSYRNATVAEFEAAIKRTAAEEAIPYIDLFSAWTADRAYRQLLFDGIHPNAAGHAQICERIKAFLHSQGRDA
jgi:lysophospholipase L1-like esterase